MWQLDGKALWWDESLTLQRSESPIGQLIAGTLLIKDGLTEHPTTDQHPPLYFLITGFLIRLAGTSEIVLRFVAVMAATALIPMVAIFAQALTRKHIVYPTTPYWAGLLAAISPFFLWYGQEARPYSLWAFLAILSTYWLWRVMDQATPDKLLTSAEEASGQIPFRSILLSSAFLIYSATVVLFLLSQYYATFLLPLHGLMLWMVLARFNRRFALLIAGLMILLGILLGSGLGWYLLSRTGGDNFEQIPLSILLPDMLNAFGMGLSVDINKVWWLDLFMGAVALLGVGWAVRSKAVRRSGGWVLPQLVLIPIAVLLLINVFHPAYMNARHISLIGGGYILAMGAGLALIYEKQRWAGIACALVFLGGAGYSTVNYFSVEKYSKDDYYRLASYIEERLLPGDLVLLNPAASWRIFDYYLPLERIDQYNQSDPDAADKLNTDYYRIPLLGWPWEALFGQIAQWETEYRRIWVIKSGTNPFMDREEQIDPWLDENLYRVSQKRFFSHSALRASMYMAEPPVYNEPIPIEGREMDIIFGQQIRLMGVDMGRPLTPDSALPITLYWKTLSETDKRYKSILRLVMRDGNGAEVELGITEREPYDGVIATEYWVPRQTIVEMTGIPPFDQWPEQRDNLWLQIQLYPTDSFEKQAVEAGSPLPEGVSISEDGLTAVIHVQ